MAQRQPKRPRGRPRTETEAVNVRMPMRMIEALDAVMHAKIAEGGPLATRPDVVRYALHDWLVGHGYLPHHESPEGAN